MQFSDNLEMISSMKNSCDSHFQRPTAQRPLVAANLQYITAIIDRYRAFLLREQ